MLPKEFKVGDMFVVGSAVVRVEATNGNDCDGCVFRQLCGDNMSQAMGCRDGGSTSLKFVEVRRLRGNTTTKKQYSIGELFYNHTTGRWMRVVSDGRNDGCPSECCFQDTEYLTCRCQYACKAECRNDKTNVYFIEVDELDVTEVKQQLERLLSCAPDFGRRESAINSLGRKMPFGNYQDKGIFWVIYYRNEYFRMVLEEGNIVLTDIEEWWVSEVSKEIKSQTATEPEYTSVG